MKMIIATHKSIQECRGTWLYITLFTPHLPSDPSLLSKTGSGVSATDESNQSVKLSHSKDKIELKIAPEWLHLSCFETCEATSHRNPEINPRQLSTTTKSTYSVKVRVTYFHSIIRTKGVELTAYFCYIEVKHSLKYTFLKGKNWPWTPIPSKARCGTRPHHWRCGKLLTQEKPF